MLQDNKPRSSGLQKQQQHISPEESLALASLTASMAPVVSLANPRKAAPTSPHKAKQGKAKARQRQGKGRARQDQWRLPPISSLPGRGRPVLLWNWPPPLCSGPTGTEPQTESADGTGLLLSSRLLHFSSLQINKSCKPKSSDTFSTSSGFWFIIRMLSLVGFYIIKMRF